jgi:hypothetical protein
MKRTRLITLALLLPLLSSCLFVGGDLDVPAASMDSSESSGEGASSEGESKTVLKSTYTLTYEKYLLREGSTSGTSLYFDYIAEIENTGETDLYLDTCEINLLDTDNTKMFSSSKSCYSYPDVIAPGEKGYFGYTAFEELDMSKEYAISREMNVELAVSDEVYLEASDLALEDSLTGGFGVSKCKVKNTTSSSQSNVCAYAVCFDSDDHPFSIMSGYTSESLVSGGAVMVDLYPYATLDVSIKADEVTRIELKAFVDRYFNI